MFPSERMDTKRSLAAFVLNNFDMESGSKKHAFTPTRISNEDRLRSTVSSSSKKFLSQNNYNQIMEMEVVLVEDLIMPLIFIMKYAIPFHDTITYDCAEKRFEMLRGAVHRKVFCILWQFIILYRLTIKVIPALSFGTSATQNEPSDSSGLSAVAKGAYLIFILFSFITFYIYWTKTKSFCKILNEIIGLSGKLHIKEKPPPRIRIVKCVAHLSWLFVLGYLLLSIGLYLISIFYPELVGNDEVGKAMNGSVSKHGRMDFIEIHTTDSIIAVQIVTAVASFMNMFGWMMTFFHIGVWAIIFRQLIMILYWRIDSMRELGLYFVLPHEIRTFNKIGMIMDDFNKIFGIALLFGAVVVVSYITPSVKHVIPGFQNLLQMSGGVHLLLSYVPMGVASVLTAEVQRVAGNFADILKEEYGKFTKECGDAAESLCGIAIVHYDLSTQGVGLKGSSFFTASYQFLTTIASLIVTYSILVVQLFPQDNSNVEV